ncbi:MAG: hypothetical protein ACFFC7_26870, partial [Candidatus Hermodarchaeota archaeon]
MTPIPTFRGNRPTKSKKIPRQYSAYRGKIHTTKLHLRYKRPRPCYPYVGKVERALYYCLDHDFYCTEIIPQPYISVEDGKGNMKEYVPDCWASFYVESTWEIRIFEAKPKAIKEKLDATDESWKRKTKLLEQYCAKMNAKNKQKRKNIAWKYMIVTEDYFNTPRYQNIRYFGSSVQINISQSHLKIGRIMLENIFQKKNPLTFQDLKMNFQRISRKEKQQFTDNLIERVISFYIFYQFLWIDWDQPFSESGTLISANFDHHIRAIPFFDVTPVELNKEIFSPEIIESEINIAAITPEQEEIALNRKKMIDPFYDHVKSKRIPCSNDYIANYPYDEKVLKSIKHEEIKGASVRTIRRWLKKYEDHNGDWKSLLPRGVKKETRESFFPNEVDQIIEEVLSDKNNRLKKPIPLYKIISNKLNSLALPVPSERTIRRR